MKNPLRKRHLRELKSDFGKYGVVFFFIIMLSGLISGFLIADKNARISYEEGFVNYNVEDGHLAFNVEPEEGFLKQLQERGELTFYDLKYFEEQLGDTEKNIRVYVKRDQVNKECLMSGRMPKTDTEIALDRLFAENADIKAGDEIVLQGKRLTVTGFVALADYSCLFEQNTDMMFDSINFGVGIMTREGFERAGSSHITYNYAWKYDDAPLTEQEEHTRSEKFTEDLKDVVKAYDTEIIQKKADALYEEASVLQEELEQELDTAAESIERTLTDAAVRVVSDALAYLSTGELLEIAMEALDEEEEEDELMMQVLSVYAEKMDTTANALIVQHLDTDTSLEDFEAMTDVMESWEDTLAEGKNRLQKPQINLHEIEDSKNYKSDMDVELDEIKDAVQKVEAAQLYDTGKILSLLEQMESLAGAALDDSEIVTITDYVPRYQNKAITFTGEDMGSDAAMVTVLNYLVVTILAFVFAVTISGTITKEASAIGTLLATGYTRAELMRHFLALPMMVTIAACICGNILGYTIFEKMFIDIYYGSFSLASYEQHFNLEAFFRTTVLTILMMFAINWFILRRKLKLTPLQFLRRELSAKKKKRGIRLSRRLPFILRFQIRILLQNLSAYMLLMIGVVLGGAIIVFGAMFGPLFEDYTRMVEDSKIASYQYILMNQAETANPEAEKYCAANLDLEREGFVTDSVMVYGIMEGSAYIHADIPKGQILVSNGTAAKYHLDEGDQLEMKDHYTGKTYAFTVGGVYPHDAALAVFMNREEYLLTFHENEDYYTGYFSNTELTDIDSEAIASVITEKDLRKLADQMVKSMGGTMGIFKVFGVIMFILLMYLLTKQIIEKNLLSISMTKILGFTGKEIGGLYLCISFFVVVCSLLLSIPVVHEILRYAFEVYLYKEMSGYIPFFISEACYIQMVVLGIMSFLAVSVLLLIKIQRVPKSEALKNVE